MEAPIAATCAFGLVAACLSRTRVRVSWARGASRVNNLLFGGVSALFLCAFVQEIVTGSFTPSLTDNRVLYLFYLSKYYEFLDIVLVSLSAPPDECPLHLHFAVHHATTPSLVWAAVASALPGQVYMYALNSALHAVMYPHFAGLWNARALLVALGTLQVVVGAMGAVYAVVASEPALVTGACGWYVAYLMCLYAVLHAREHKLIEL